MELNEAIKSLDPRKDEHWTENGLPKLDVLKELTGKSYSRKEVTDAAPLITRDRLVKGENVAVPTDVDADKDDNPDVKLTENDPGFAPVAVDELAALQAELVDLTQKYDMVEKHKKEVDQTFADLTASIDKISNKIDSIKPKETTTDAIQMYLASQKKQREERAAKTGPADIDRRMMTRARPNRSRM